MNNELPRKLHGLRTAASLTPIKGSTETSDSSPLNTRMLHCLKALAQHVNADEFNVPPSSRNCFAPPYCLTLGSITPSPSGLAKFLVGTYLYVTLHDFVHFSPKVRQFTSKLCEHSVIRTPACEWAAGSASQSTCRQREKNSRLSALA